MRYLPIIIAAVMATQAADAQHASDTTRPDTLKHETLDTTTVTAPAGPQVYRGSATRVWEIANTRVALSFNWKEKTADAREWIKLHPYFYPTDTMVLDAKSMRIEQVELVSKKGNTPVSYTYADDQVTIHFNHKYNKKDTAELYIKYVAMPYATATGGSQAITDDRGLYFINTDHKIPNKPVEIWTQGETESNSHWMVTIDKPNSRTTTQIELTVPDSMVTLSNGALIKQVKGTHGLRTDIWKMDMPIQVYAAMFAIGKFSIVKDKWRGKDLNYYVEPEYAPYAKDMFRHTGDMIDYFSERTGVTYPWNKYDQVVVRDYVSGAMENTTAALFGEFMNENRREIADHDNEDIVSHELFHEWFGDYVTCESWSNITVNESFANYGEQLWRAHRYGKAEGDHLAWNDLQLYVQSAAFKDPQLVRFYYDSREDVFDAISYNKGGATLRYLNGLMGDDAFDRAMNLYLTKNALHSAEAHNWRLAVEEATGQDWNWFFNEWYYHAGHPVVKVAYHYNDTTQQLTVITTQAQDDSTYMYLLPLKALVAYGDDKKIIDWKITAKHDTFTYAYKNGIRPTFVPDVEHWVPGEIKDGKKPAMWLAQYKATDDFVSRLMAVNAAGKLLSDSSSQAIIDLALNDPMYFIRRNALVKLANTTLEKYQRKWRNQVLTMATTDSDKLVRAQAFYALGEWKYKPGIPAMKAALHDSSYSVAGNALEALNKIDNDTAYGYAKALLKDNPQGTLATAIWTVLGKKAADEDVIIFEQKAPYMQGQKLFSFSFALTSYLKNVKSDESFSRALNTYATIAINQEMKAYREFITGSLFQFASETKDNTKSDDKDVAAAANARINVIKTALQRVTSAENDPKTKADDEKKMKDTFE